VVFDKNTDRTSRIRIEGNVLYSSSFGFKDTTYMKTTNIPPMKVIKMNSAIQYDIV